VRSTAIEQDLIPTLFGGAMGGVAGVVIGAGENSDNDRWWGDGARFEFGGAL